MTDKECVNLIWKIKEEKSLNIIQEDKLSDKEKESLKIAKMYINMLINKSFIIPSIARDMLENNLILKRFK